ncbi:unnamed protein product [Ceutorhynchus assimilis]|uniref:Uncharacterized protein n=1 Tax=Ceutorhynchus assimilis TaxID=467358 RepID=A0A9N9MVF8_9CUCU|nr:unnamed protein product [Ceutorhynchus assimilis]
MGSRARKILKLLQSQEQHNSSSANNNTQIVQNSSESNIFPGPSTSKSFFKDQQNFDLNFTNTTYPGTSSDTKSPSDDCSENTVSPFSLNFSTRKINEQSNKLGFIEDATTEYPLAEIHNNRSQFADIHSSENKMNEPNLQNEPYRSQVHSYSLSPHNSRNSDKNYRSTNHSPSYSSLLSTDKINEPENKTEPTTNQVPTYSLLPISSNSQNSKTLTNYSSVLSTSQSSDKNNDAENKTETSTSQVPSYSLLPLPCNSQNSKNINEPNDIPNDSPVQSTSQNSDENNEPNNKTAPSTNQVPSYSSLPSTSQNSDRYIVENRGSTKISLRKVKLNYRVSDSEQEPFSSGSSDNYEPDSSSSSSESDSSSSSGSEPEVMRPVTTDQAEQQPDSPKKGKKRLRKESNWKRANRKKSKNSGQEYTSARGKTVLAKSMKPPCQNKCILSCSKKISQEYRQQLFKEYWELGSYQRQRDFLGSCVDKLNLTYRRISSATPRNPNCAFYFYNNGEKMRICKTFLINTLGISEKTLRTVIYSKVSGNGVIVEDRRGKHNKHKKIDEEIINSVREHINSIPRVESHYVRSDTSREFIDGGLSIAEMHRNYSERRRILDKPIASYDFYAKIFNTEFNIGFFNPKKDQCDLCESYKNSEENEKKNLENKYQEHLNEKILSREEKEKDKIRAKDGEITLAVYDLQAVLPVPIGQTSAFFYKSRLNCYNFTITEIANDRTKSFFWHEGLGNRGAIEIGSCVLIYLEELSKIRPGLDVVFYSDNCGGQQKNRQVIAIFVYQKITSCFHNNLLSF